MSNYFVEKRRLDKLQLLETIKNNPDMDREQLIGIFSLKTGLRVELIKTYIEELKQAKVIE